MASRMANGFNVLHIWTLCVWESVSFNFLFFLFLYVRPTVTGRSVSFRLWPGLQQLYMYMLYAISTRPAEQRGGNRARYSRVRGLAARVARVCVRTARTQVGAKLLHMFEKFMHTYKKHARSRARFCRQQFAGHNHPGYARISSELAWWWTRKHARTDEHAAEITFMHTYYVYTQPNGRRRWREREREKKTHRARVMEGTWLGWNINTQKNWGKRDDCNLTAHGM